MGGERIRRYLAGFLAGMAMLSGALAEPMPARDTVFVTPNEDSEVLCDHDFCFWQMTEGETDEDVVWEVLTQPITVLSGKQREQIRVRARPEEDCDEYVGVVTCARKGTGR